MIIVIYEIESQGYCTLKKQFLGVELVEMYWIAAKLYTIQMGSTLHMARKTVAYVGDYRSCVF